VSARLLFLLDVCQPLSSGAGVRITESAVAITESIFWIKLYFYMRSVLWPLSALDGLAGDAEGGSAAPENVDLALRVGSVRGLGGPPAR